MNLTTVLLQAQPQGGLGSIDDSFVLIFIVFYFFMIRPQQKKTKDAKKFRDSLQKGVKVVTIGGLHGNVVEVNDKTVLVQAETT